MKYISPSDYTAIAPNYATGQGYYTNSGLVADLLQIPAFTASSSPTYAQIGEFIKRTEDYIDELTDTSWRPITYIDEYHNFSFSGIHGNLPQYWTDFVGYTQLRSPNIRKLIRLEVWQGNSWLDLASASATVTIGDYTNVTSIALQLPNSGLVFNLLAGTTTSRFDSTYGNKTAAEELVALINETYPAKTANLTGATAAKSQTDSTGAKQVSDYFYATVDSKDQTKLVISSLLTGEDGANCTISVSGSGLSKTDFTDNEEMERLGNFWMIESDGKVFFRKNFPYQERQSIRATYIAGKGRVPGIISDAATKLAACEVLRHDDSTVLIAESGAQIDIKSKYDLLKVESDKLLGLLTETIFLIE
jgi:hypothetical protein